MASDPSADDADFFMKSLGRLRNWSTTPPNDPEERLSLTIEALLTLLRLCNWFRDSVESFRARRLRRREFLGALFAFRVHLNEILELRTITLSVVHELASVRFRHGRGILHGYFGAAASAAVVILCAASDLNALLDSLLDVRDLMEAFATLFKEMPP